MRAKILKDLFCTEGTSTISSSKFWFNITNLVVLVVYSGISYKYFTVLTEAGSLDGIAMFTAVIAGIVTGNKIANSIVKKRYAEPPQYTYTPDRYDNVGSRDGL